MRLRRLLWLAAPATLAPAAAFAQFNQATIISTSMGGIVSGTYGYFKYVSATYGLGTGASKLASLTDVDISGKVSGSVLVYTGATTSWTALPIQNVMSTTTILTNWPDAIGCLLSTGTYYIYLATALPASSGSLYLYRPIRNTGGDTYAEFNSDGTYNSASSTSDTNTSNCNGRSISQLYASGQAFNFIGNSGSGSGDRITSGTTSMVAQSGGLISVTTNGTNTGYFNSSGVLTLPGISATANLTSVTTLYASGKVGIGTAAPYYTLQVRPAVNANLQVRSGSGVVGDVTVNAANDADTVQVSLTLIASSILLQPTGGNVGIGTTTPGMPLEVVGTSAVGELRLRNSNAGAKYFNLGTDSGNNMVIYNNVGTGVYVADGATSWTANSDRRIKTNIRTLTHDEGLGAIEKLNPVTFHWKNPKASKERQVGVIAQDVQKVLPELITMGPPTANTPSGTLGVQYTGLIAPLIKAVQELKATFDGDHATLEALKADNNNLRVEFEAYKRAHP